MAQDVQDQIGRNIRALRLKAGLSQELFSEKAGLNRVHLSEIERGRRNVSIQTLKIIADTLGVRIVDLVRGL